ncbi:LOW QUALITY PROTEIN: V-type proton ATPase 116 kDa subunit a-like [Thrips palmi]|uniref:V-type proton ATPase subunit a n=1 Tax=Thrips palmi TaxID=161013 RepID=A0A6P8ZIT8_THRPL|nr:LOW QUALITY PROTEIN: V-type proton ATPase 116 kDa subunit a-like [Thrips palmi]
MFRSEEVVLCQLFVQQEAAFASIHMLGEAGVVEFRDLNAEVHPMMRKFVNEVRRCEELERKLRYIEEEMGKDGVAVDTPRHQPRPALNPRDIIEMEANLEKTESEIMELSRNAANLQASFVELTEMQQVLEKAQVFLKELEELPSKVFAGEDRGRLGYGEWPNSLTATANFGKLMSDTARLTPCSVTAGVLPRERLPAFETMLWRVSRGNVLLRQADLDDLVKDPKTIMTIFFGGRYIILLMGLFSMYTGLMYNDLFSVSVNLVGWSAWSAPPLSELQPGPTTLDPSKHYQGVPYPIGLDPVWQFAENKIIFLNSFKMKLSIIIGIIHMVFGVSLSVFNHVANRRPVMILLDFLPKILFLLLLFGYLAALMVFKWWKYGPEQGAEDVALSPGCAPSVLITFINMMLRNHPDLPAGSACSPWMYGGQAGVEQALLYSALACVPFMLLARPAYVLCTQRRRRPQRPRNDDDDAVTWRHDEDGDDQSEDKAAEDEEPFGEMMVHQCIHTVEYVLSTVSHTASYLRLWALSLAHSQLSHVLWSMVLRKGLAMQWVLPLPLLFAGWAFFTVAILVLMEGLSAFLHTLRLHWVEFMSKFYEGEGYPFRPFSFKTIFQSVD